MATCRGCGESFRQEFPAMRLCWDCWRKRKDGERRVEIVQVEVPVLADTELLRGAIALTHPDRHPPERSELANRITAGLLELLKKAGRSA